MRDKILQQIKEISFLDSEVVLSGKRKISFFKINDTDIYLILDPNGKIFWKKMKVNTSVRRNISFEKLLELVPKNIQEELIFNINLFRKI